MYIKFHFTTVPGPVSGQFVLFYEPEAGLDIQTWTLNVDNQYNKLLIFFLKNPYFSNIIAKFIDWKKTHYTKPLQKGEFDIKFTDKPITTLVQ